MTVERASPPKLGLWGGKLLEKLLENVWGE